MEICRYCGEPIELRYVGGVVTPIHLNGNWCSSLSGAKDDSRAALYRSYGEYDSYLDPNARCPVCKKPVFFYRSPHGGRVFFDDVGWPWPKHPCTDNWHGSEKAIGGSPGISRTSFRSVNDDHLCVYLFVKIVDVNSERSRILLKNSRLSKSEPKQLTIELKVSELKAAGIKVADIVEAPSIIIPKRLVNSLGDVQISFICNRLTRIVEVSAELTEK